MACGRVTFKNSSLYIAAGGRKVIDGVTEVRSEIFVADDEDGKPKSWRTMDSLGGG